MKKIALLLVLGGLLLVGCAPVDNNNYLYAGQTYDIKTVIGFYITRLPNSQASTVPATPSALSEQKKKDLLESSDNICDIASRRYRCARAGWNVVRAGRSDGKQPAD